MLLLTLIPMAVVVYVDPLHVLYDEKEEPVYLHPEERYRNAGLIRRHLFQKKDRKTVLLGSSFMQNTMDEDIAAHARLPESISLCIKAIQAKDLPVIGDQVIKSETVENIIVSIEPVIYFTSDSPFHVYFPRPLYDGSFLEKVQAMTRMDIVRMALRILKGEEPKTTHEQFLNNMAEKCAAREFSAYSKKMDEVSREFAEYSARLPEPGARERSGPGGHADLRALMGVAAWLNRIPERIRVHVLIPPSFQGRIKNLVDFDLYSDCLGRLLRSVEGRKNITVYAFDDIPAITTNMANYFDGVHYGIGVNRYMLKAIGARKHVLNTANLDAYLAAVWEIRKHGGVVLDKENTVSFEGPLDEAAFSKTPYPVGPRPLRLPD